MTDADRVLLWLRENHEITPLTAWTEFGCYRLADAIHKLRKRGFDISTQMDSGVDCNGDKCTFARYSLHE